MTWEFDKVRHLLNARLAEASTNTLYGTVEAVNEDNLTCEVTIGEISYDDVLLFAVVDEESKGLIVVPKVGSRVLVSRIATSSRWFVEMFSDVDKILLTIGEQLKMTIDGNFNLEIGEDVKVSITDQVEISVRDDVKFCLDDNLKASVQGVKMEMTSSGIEMEAGPAKISMDNGQIGIESPSGNLYKTLHELCLSLEMLTVTTPMGPSGPPINAIKIAQIRTELANYLKGKL